MNEQIRDEAEPMADEIIQKVAYYIRYKLERWPTTADLADMKRIVKSIIVQHLARRENV